MKLTSRLFTRSVLALAVTLTPMIAVGDSSPAAASPMSVSQRPAAVPTDWYLEMPSLRFGADIQVGGQSSIDAGNVTLFDEWGPTIAPGEVGTLWLAGHRSSHGAVFRRLPNLRVNQTVNVNSYDEVFTYRITSRSVVGRDLDPTVIYGSDPAAKRIVLQCSWTRGRTIIYAGTLESVTPVSG
jgi:sortase (surface protein transpeptidase)